MDDWKYVKKLRESKHSRIWLAFAVITAILALAAAIFAIIKLCMAKNCCCEDCFEDDDFQDFEDEDDDHDGEDGYGDDDSDDGDDDDHGSPVGGGAVENCDENGCCYTNDKDFVK